MVFGIFEKKEKENEEEEEEQISLPPTYPENVAQYMLDFEKFMYFLEGALSGRRVLSDKENPGDIKLSPKPEFEPLMNKKGISSILSVLQIQLHPKISTTIMERGLIGLLFFTTQIRLIEMIFKKAEEWKIDPEKINVLTNTLANAILSVYLRNERAFFLRALFQRP